MPMTTDVYFHKLIIFRGWKQEVKFRTSQELFSAHDIDTGSRFLLRTIVEAGYVTPQSILDLGCGYGALGLVLKSLYPESAVHLTDRDALAVEYAHQNAVLNNLSVEAYASLDYLGVTRNDYDLIVCNVPGKAGDSVIGYLLGEAGAYLKSGGIMCIVVVSPLEAIAEKKLAELTGAEVILKRARSGHTVFHYRFTGSRLEPKKTSVEAGVYRRKEIKIKQDKLAYDMETAFGLPEFDTLSYDTELLFEAIEGMKNRQFKHLLALNPLQGHVPSALWRCFTPQSITLAGRDLLALMYSRLNLLKNGCPPDRIQTFHQSGLELTGRYDLIAGVLPEENKEALERTFEQAAGLLDQRGTLAIAGGSTAITRLETLAATQPELVIKGRERRRGYSSLVVEKR
jgi:16S rRNA G1207 methylase RsmC